MTPLAALRRAMRRLDARLAREVVRLRARYQLSLDEFRGVYVSDEQVDALLAQRGLAQTGKGPLPRLSGGALLGAVVQRFGLSPLETELLVLAVAPEIDPKYGTVLAYLNDDAQRRQPTLDLAWRLFGDVTGALAAGGKLFAPGLLAMQADSGAERRARASQAFVAHPLVVAHLLGEPAIGASALDAAAPAPTQRDPPEALADIAPLLDPAAPPPVVVLVGRPMSGRTDAVRRLARSLGRMVVRLDLGDAPDERLRDAVLAARLADALLLIDPGPASGAAGFAPLTKLLRRPPVPVFVLANEGADWRQGLAGSAVLEVRFALPDAPARRRLWAGALADAGLLAEPGAIDAVAGRFRLTPPQIRAAGATLRLERRLRPGERAVVGTDDLIAASRTQSSAALGGLATRIAPRHDWNDLVLPAATLRQLRHFGGAIRHRERVFADWGFARGTDGGVIALFSGGSGTGKSLSAGVLARDAGLEIWRIDLSSVISKYIGETEKQLERIFTLAGDGNAVLFFDEADALLGKRSEVKDAHDRYANIEVAYLLQRLEAYDGVAILATNLARNVDRAFSRRMHFVIEFPLPDPVLRERLWRQAFPAAAPLAADIDYGFLARQFAFAGGDIRVAALDAAFAAAAEGASIDMARLLQAVVRQLLKQGNVPSASDFRPYQTLLAEAVEVGPRRLAAE